MLDVVLLHSECDGLVSIRYLMEAMDWSFHVPRLHRELPQIYLIIYMYTYTFHFSRAKQEIACVRNHSHNSWFSFSLLKLSLKGLEYLLITTV